MQSIAAFITGLVFGLGLLWSGMANPAKVQAFLDVAGRWDPSLAFVMVGAIAVAAVGFAIARGRATALLGGPIRVPKTRDIDSRLVIGSAVFGIGWGLAGICPGPSLVLLGAGVPQGLAFVAAMLAGMAAFEWFERGRRRRGHGPQQSDPMPSSRSPT